jgi:predicted permease
VPEVEIGPNAEVAIAYDEIGARLSETPGVTSVAATSCLPLDETCRSFDAVFFEDAPLGPDEAAPVERVNWVTGGYFETLEQPMVAGRPITRTDVRDRNPVVVVSRSFAERHWGDPASALGHRITWGTPQSSAWSEVVGVVADTHDDGVDQPAPGVLYWPLATVHPMFPSQEFVPRVMSFAVRIERGSTDALAPEIRDVVREVHANLALADLGTFDRLLTRSMARTSFTMVMLLISAGVALALGLVGIYGVVSYVVSQRTREIGVRIALGAERADVQRMVVRHGFVLGIVGVAVGLVAAAGLTRLMSALLYGVAATDPLTFASVSVMLTAVTLVASYLPARRASRTDPLVALRAE